MAFPQKIFHHNFPPKIYPQQFSLARTNKFNILAIVLPTPFLSISWFFLMAVKIIWLVSLFKEWQAGSDILCQLKVRNRRSATLRQQSGFRKTSLVIWITHQKYLVQHEMLKMKLLWVNIKEVSCHYVYHLIFCTKKMHLAPSHPFLCYFFFPPFSSTLILCSLLGFYAICRIRGQIWSEMTKNKVVRNMALNICIIMYQK